MKVPVAARTPSVPQSDYHFSLLLSVHVRRSAVTIHSVCPPSVSVFSPGLSSLSFGGSGCWRETAPLSCR